MKQRSRSFRVLKWTGTILCLLIVVAFVFSLHYLVRWESATNHRAYLLLGAATYTHLRPDSLVQLPLAPSPGWAIHERDWRFSCCWQIEINTSRIGYSIVLPLWMPFVLVAIPTGILWFHEWEVGRRLRQRLLAVLTPTRPQRLTFWLVAAFCVLHAGVVLACFWGLITWGGSVGLLAGTRLGDVAGVGLVVLLWSTPVWGYLWARAFTAYRNRLFRHQMPHCCGCCGYDLTGNVSGRCPECGAACEPSGSPE